MLHPYPYDSFAFLAVSGVEVGGDCYIVNSYFHKFYNSLMSLSISSSSHLKSLVLK